MLWKCFKMLKAWTSPTELNNTFSLTTWKTFGKTYSNMSWIGLCSTHCVHTQNITILKTIDGAFGRLLTEGTYKEHFKDNRLVSSWTKHYSWNFVTRKQRHFAIDSQRWSNSQPVLRPLVIMNSLMVQVGDIFTRQHYIKHLTWYTNCEDNSG